MVLSIIGLALDLVGAVVLARGLFRPALPLVPGYARSPEDAATDGAYGTAGALYLAAGFSLQAAASFGANLSASGEGKALAAVATLGVGGALAVVLYGLVYMVLLPRFDRRAREEYPGIDAGALRRAPRGYRFWRHERVRS